MEEQQFQQKLKQYKDTVYRIAYTYLRNKADAEDVAQETFLKFFMHKEPFPDEGMEKAWLIRVTINACHDLCRSAWHKNRAELPDAVFSLTAICVNPATVRKGTRFTAWCSHWLYAISLCQPMRWKNSRYSIPRQYSPNSSHGSCFRNGITFAEYRWKVLSDRH